MWSAEALEDKEEILMVELIVKASVRGETDWRSLIKLRTRADGKTELCRTPVGMWRGVGVRCCAINNNTP